MIALLLLLAAVAEAEWFQNLVDHFDKNNMATYPQFYTVNSTYEDPKATSDVPTFIFLGGEAPLGFFDFQEVSALHWASVFKARYIGIEHRYYGQSMPTPDFSYKGLLGRLTVEQALADAAAFIESSVRNDTAHRYGKWVVFGCSYSGSLSAWFRTKYPNLVVASVAPSGPVLAQVDYASFLPHFDDVAPASCVQAARAATQAIETLFKIGASDYVAKLFNSCDSLRNRTDQIFFEHQVGTTVGSANQFNNPNQNWPLNDTCATLTSAANPLVGFAAAVGGSNGVSDCNTYTVAGFQAQMSPVNNSDRAWWFQKCTEFGFFKSSAKSGATFFDDVDAKSIGSLCEVIFGVKGLAPDVDGFNKRWGAKQLNGTNIMFTNGRFDPWSLLSITTSYPGVDAVNYDAGHCAPMTVPTALDPPSLIAARASVQAFLKKNLGL